MPYVEILKESRKFTQSSSDTSQEFEYVIANEDFDSLGDDTTYGTFFTPNDDVALVNYIAANFPSFRTFRTIDGFDIILFLTNYSAQEITAGNWRLNLTYGIPQDQSQGSGSYVQFGFSVGGETTHVSRSKEVKSAVSRTGSSIIPPDNMRGIGLTKNSIEGADIPGKGLRFNITAYYTPDIWDTSFLTLFYNMVPTYNNASFYGFSAGEVLFLGCDGQGDLYRLVPLKFEFLAKQNVAALADDPFDALTALGHDIIDYLYITEESNDFPVRNPFYRYVHRVFDPSNFSLLGI